MRAGVRLCARWPPRSQLLRVYNTHSLHADAEQAFRGLKAELVDGREQEGSRAGGSTMVGDP